MKSLLHRSLVLLITAALLSACGFHLRGSEQDVTIAGAKVAIESDSPYAELNRALREALTRAQVTTVSAGESAQLLLKVHDEKLTRRTQTVDQYGRASDYELIYTLSYSLLKEADDKSPPRSLSARRDYGFDNRNLLGKAEEENELVREMQNEIAQRLLRQIRYSLAEVQ